MADFTGFVTGGNSLAGSGNGPATNLHGKATGDSGDIVHLGDSTLTVGTIDRETAGTLTIAGSGATATGIAIGNSGFTTTFSSPIDNNSYWNMSGLAAPALSSAGEGRIYFDSTSNTFKVSENGGAYANLVGAGWTDDGGVVRLNTATDSVSIGTTVGLEKVHIHKADSTAVFSRYTNTTTGTGATDGVDFGLNASEEATIWNYEATDFKLGLNNVEELRMDQSARVLELFDAIGTGASSNVLRAAKNQNSITAMVVENTNEGVGDTSSRSGFVTNSGSGGSIVQGSLYSFPNVAGISDTQQNKILLSASSNSDALYLRHEKLDTNGRIWFSTYVVGDPNPVQMVLAGSNGDLGLGNFTPGGLNIDPRERLHLHKTDSTAISSRYTNTTTGTGATDGVNFGLNASEEAMIWNYENTAIRLATNNLERMVIEPGGHVGIGLSDPGHYLHIQQNADLTTSINIENTNNSAAASARIWLSGISAQDGGFLGYFPPLHTSSGSVFADRLVLNAGSNVEALWLRHNSSTGGGAIYFTTDTNVAGGADPVMMTLTSGGDLYLGRTVGGGSPQNRLDVDGAAVIGSTYAGSEVAPTDGLAIQGQIKVAGGTPGVDKVLRSDAAGLATWVDPNTLITAPGWTDDGGVVRLTTAGDAVGIGVATLGAGNKLDVDGAVVIGSSYAGSASAATDGLTVEGNVLIGNATPGGFDFHIKKTKSGGATVSHYVENESNAGYSTIAARGKNGVTPFSVYIQAAGSTVASDDYAGYGKLRSETGANGLVLMAGGTGTANDLLFAAGPVGTTGEPERMRIKGTGIVVIGTGEGKVTAATGTTLRAPDITTGGAGNIAGADLTISPGLGTGTGDPGKIIIQTVPTTTAGDNLQSRATVLEFDDKTILLSDAVNLAVNTTTGTKIGTASSQKLGFFGATPVVQRTDISALTDNSGGTADNTVQALTDPADAPATADALRDDLVLNLIPELRNNFADLTDQVNLLRTALRDLGLMA